MVKGRGGRNEDQKMTKKEGQHREEETQKPEKNMLTKEVFQIWDKNQLSLRAGGVIGFGVGLRRQCLSEIPCSQ